VLSIFRGTAKSAENFILRLDLESKSCRDSSSNPILRIHLLPLGLFVRGDFSSARSRPAPKNPVAPERERSTGISIIRLPENYSILIAFRCELIEIKALQPKHYV
jgi:hypothetical protein